MAAHAEIAQMKEVGWEEGKEEEGRCVCVRMLAEIRWRLVF